MIPGPLSYRDFRETGPRLFVRGRPFDFWGRIWVICWEEKTTRSDRLKFRLLGIEFFSPIYNGVRIFPALYPTRHIFFQNRKFFLWVFPCKIFFSRNQSGIPAASVIRESFACGIRKTTKFCFERRNPGLWNPEYSSRNLEFTHDWNPEPKFHYQGIRNAVHGIWKLWRGIQKPRLFPLIIHGATP